MNFRPIALFISALLAVLMVGCSTTPTRDAQKLPLAQNLQRGPVILSVTNAVPGSTYDVDIYVVKAGDTAAMIAKRNQMSLRELLVINPDLDPRRLFVGMQIRVYEKKIE